MQRHASVPVPEFQAHAPAHADTFSLGLCRQKYLKFRQKSLVFDRGSRSC
eukprot:jgi/Botrbrau1/10835/Bobra.0025s0014.1